jgi:5'-3' exonuclease
MKRLIVDGHNLATRSFYTGNLFNFFNMVRTVLADVGPDMFMVVFDDPKNCWRRKLYPSYKDNRNEKPQDLITYLDLLPRALVEAQIPIAVWDEADDYMYSVTRTNDHTDYILSSDKDMFGAVNETTYVITFKGNFSEREVYGIGNVEQTIGIPPCRFSLYKALVGDQSDNVGGVHKIGPKKALDIMLNYAPAAKSVDELYTLCYPNGPIPQKYLDLLIPEIVRALSAEKILSLKACLDLDNKPVEWRGQPRPLKAIQNDIEAASQIFKNRAEKHSLLLQQI